MRRTLTLIIVLALSPSPLHAAIAFVQSQTGSTAGAGSFTVTLSALTTGNKVICQMKTSNESVTFSASATNVTFQTAVGPVDDPGAPLIRTYQFYGRITTGGATVVTITASSGTPTMGGWCAEFSGLETVFSLDQTGQGVNAAGTAHDISGTITTTQANELLIGGCGPSGAGSWTVGSGFTGIYTSTSGSIPSGQYKIVSSTGTYSTPMTNGTSVASVCLLGTYKMASGGGGGGGTRQSVIGWGVF